MGYILSVYSRMAFKDYPLPAVDNTDHTITLDREIFQMKEDIRLDLEVREQKWRFRSSDTYIIRSKRGNTGAGEICANQILELSTTDEAVHLTFVVRENLSPMRAFARLDISRVSQICIGKEADCDISVNVMGLVSHQHMILSFDRGGCMVTDSSQNGVYVNSRRVERTQMLRFGDVINLFGMKIIWMGRILSVDLGYIPGILINNPDIRVLGENTRFSYWTVPPFKGRISGGKDNFSRNPRSILPIPTEKMEIEAPPAQERLQKQSMLLAIGPSMTMAIPMVLGSSLAVMGSSMGGNSVFMYVGLVTAVSAALIGSIWAVVDMRRVQKETQLKEEDRKRSYTSYLEVKDREIGSRFEYTKDALRRMYPSPSSCCGLGADSLELWGRNASQKDFLYERLGVGTLPFPTEIDIPKAKFHVYKDPLEDGPKEIYDRYASMDQVPVGVDLAANQLISIIGGRNRIRACQVMKSLITQIAAANSYTDVKICMVYNGEKSREKELLEDVKWLPHVWSEDRKFRFIADNRRDAAEVFFQLAEVVRSRSEEKNQDKDKKELPLPYYVLFLTEPSWLDDELLNKYVQENDPAYGLTCLLAVSGYEELPNSCHVVIQNEESYHGMYTVGTDEGERQDIVFDVTDNAAFHDFAVRLAGLCVKENIKTGEIPEKLTFMDMYHAHRLQDLKVEERWLKNRCFETMRVPIGEKTGGALCYLDVHEKYHGPHGLIAGTTGSGKSETLQTYILSLAVNYSPEDVGFFLIDYKGGGMANLFTRLPHMMGSISNLSGNQVRRAMISIKSENKRRQKLFNENGVNNINQYSQLYRSHEISVPLPHLFIIIDEFAELKREEPEFMQELISVAQVGRSLGVHLILSTQKPAGTVNENIWSNSKFRLCLRVQDRADSMDMLHKPDAAFLTATGRGYLQVGNDELYEQFQSAWSGAVYEEYSGTNTESVQMLTVTGRTAMTGNRMKIRRQEEQKKVWIASLLRIIELAEAKGEQESGEDRTDLVFAELKHAGIDYPENDYNRRRMEELLALKEKTEMKSSSADSRKESDVQMQRAEAILREAEQRGSKLPDEKRLTQLDAIAAYLEEVAAEQNYDRRFSLWMPVLPEQILLAALGGFDPESAEENWKEESRTSLAVPLGLIDDPVNQAQFPLELDLIRCGHVLAVGSVGSGKSTFLQTFAAALICRYSPRRLHMYLLDFSTHMLDAFEKAPHVGGIVHEEELGRADKLFRMLFTELKVRKQKLQGGTYEQYMRKESTELPAIVVMLDNYSSFREKTNEQYSQLIGQLIREGAGAGMYLVMTAGGIGSQDLERSIAENIRTVIGLQLTDKFAYGDCMHTMNIQVLPEAGIRGRGLAQAGDSVLEFQTAQAVSAEDDYERVQKLEKISEKMAAGWTGSCARKIPEIPVNPTKEIFLENEKVQEMLAEKDLLPLGYSLENADIYSIDLKQNYCYALSGTVRTGKTNTLRLLLAELTEPAAAVRDPEIYVYDNTGELREETENCGAHFLQDPEDLFYTFQDLIPVIKERSVLRKQLQNEGLTEEEIFVRMSEERQIFFLIDNMESFIQAVEDPGEGIASMAGFLENITEKGRLLNMFFIFAVDSANMDRGSSRIYSIMTEEKRGIHFGGDVDRQLLFAFDHIGYLERDKKVKAGIGFLSDAERTEECSKVVVPLVKK
ncbi:MAG: type VII secretion protein EssC [Eubacteriales bacterium]|nr:type VII secretion protein EssC [Eubacteriales bacterium]